MAPYSRCAREDVGGGPGRGKGLGAVIVERRLLLGGQNQRKELRKRREVISTVEKKGRKIE